MSEKKKPISGRIDDVSSFIRSYKFTMSTYISNKGVPTLSSSSLSSIIENINKIDSKTGNEIIVVICTSERELGLKVFSESTGTKDLGLYDLSTDIYSGFGKIYFFDLNGSSISKQGKVYLRQDIPYNPKEHQIYFFGTSVTLSTDTELSGNYNVSIEFNL